jgi:hypothetical protein
MQPIFFLILKHKHSIQSKQKMLAGVAQLAEQLIRNQQVRGSNPRAGSKKFKGLWLKAVNPFFVSGKKIQFVPHLSRVFYSRHLVTLAPVYLSVSSFTVNPGNKKPSIPRAGEEGFIFFKHATCELTLLT